MNGTVLSSGHVFARGSVVAVTPLREQSYTEVNPSTSAQHLGDVFRYVFDVVGIGFRVTIAAPDKTGWCVQFTRYLKPGQALSPAEEKSKAEVEARNATERAKAEALRVEAMQMIGELS